MSVRVTSSLARDIMSPDLLTAYEGWTIHRLAEFFIKHQISAAPVIASDHELVGVVSVEDVFRFHSMTENEKGNVMRNHYRDSCGQEINQEDLRIWVKDADRNCTVHQIMIHEVIAVDAGCEIGEIINILLQKNLHRIFMTDNKKVIGVITVMDVLRALQQR